MVSNNSSFSRLANWLSPRLTERNCFILLFALFLILSIIIAFIPYEPSVDLADATTNDIWVEYYSEGIHHIPYDKWNHSPTQSVVVEYEGQYVVVNEKGPGHVIMLLPFHMLGIDFLFAPLMIAFAVFSTYMLGKRLANWRVGFIAALLVLTNVTVLVMWYRSYWTDASTMHMLVLSIWLLVEANYWFNGRSLDPRKQHDATRKQRFLAVGLGILSGLAFGASVSTRYPTALILIPMVLYVIAFYLLRSWPNLKKGKIRMAAKKSLGMWVILGVFLLGLMCVLVPLMQYNTTYFGNPLSSGYDQTLIIQFNPNQGLTDRDTSGEWSSDFGSMLSNAFSNLIVLTPLLISRMPALIFLPVGVWLLRKRPFLILLLLWIVINFFTYLSISWVDMYANLPGEILHEPRYFMPALPAIALLGGVAIDRLAPWVVRMVNKKHDASPERRKKGTALVIILIVGALALWSAVPAANYFANLEPGGALSPHGPQQGAIVVTTDQLNNDPLNYKYKLVKVESAIVVGINNNIITIQSEGSINPNGIRALWPPGEVPDVNIGDRIDVTGIFTNESIPIMPQGYFIKVMRGPGNN